jgi:hypothetical protein
VCACVFVHVCVCVCDCVCVCVCANTHIIHMYTYKIIFAQDPLNALLQGLIPRSEEE